MEKSIKANTKIKLLDKRYNEMNLKNLIWGALDWAGIMDMLKSDHKPVMNVKFYLVRFKDWKRLYPGKMDKDTMELIERNEDGASTILLQDLTDDKNYDIKAFIKTGCYLYASTDKTKIGGWTRK